VSVTSSCGGCGRSDLHPLLAGGGGLGRPRGQGACLTVPLDLGNVEVCGCEAMGVGSVGLGVPSKPSSCCGHLFGPQLSSHVESSLSPNPNRIPSPSHPMPLSSKYPARWHSPLPTPLSTLLPLLFHHSAVLTVFHSISSKYWTQGFLRILSVFPFVHLRTRHRYRVT
jgi:hypothetical protein